MIKGFCIRRAPARLLAAGILAMTVVLLQACVTTVQSSTFKADKQQEIDRRVEAANAYLRKGNTEQAVNHLRRALALDPNSAPIHATLGQVFWTTGEYELCEEHFQRAISVDPKFSRARNNYAAFLYDRGRYKEAIKQLELVIADTLYDARASAFINMGKAYLKVGRDAEAEEAFTRAAKLDRRQWPALLELADMNYRRGDYRMAERFYELFRETGVRQTPQSLLLGINLAVVSGHKDDEASYVLQLKGMYPDSNEYREYLKLSRGK